MIRSGNEIHAHAKKAALGAQIEAGCAEEIANACLWLLANKFDGMDAVLDAIEAESLTACEIEKRDESYYVADVNIATGGPNLVDFCMANETSIQIDNMDVPLLLVGMLGAASADFGCSVEVVFSNENKCLINAGSYSDSDLKVSQHALISKKSEIGASNRPAKVQHAFEIEDAVWNALQLYAFKTYVPASEASRLTGAGAGLTDND